MFYFLAEAGAITILLLVGLTQVLVPAYKGTPWFPIFRKRGVYNEIARANDKIDDEELELERELLLRRAKRQREKRLELLRKELEEEQQSGDKA